LWTVLDRHDRFSTPAIACRRPVQSTELHRSGCPPVVVSFRDARSVPTTVVALHLADPSQHVPRDPFFLPDPLVDLQVVFRDEGLGLTGVIHLFVVMPTSP